MTALLRVQRYPLCDTFVAEKLPETGEGIVYAASLVVRAATPQTRAHVPYNIVLVDTVEGFRMMAHGDNDLAIGDKVTARFVQFAGRLVPYFEKAK